MKYFMFSCMVFPFFKKKKINSKARFGLGEEYVCAVVGGEQ